MVYQEINPDPSLKEYILCYWKFTVSELKDSEEPLRHFFPPDGCTSLIFVSIPKFQFKDTILFGPTKLITEKPVIACSSILGIRLKPGIVQQLFPILPLDLKDQSLSPVPVLDNFDYGTIHEKLLEEGDHFAFVNDWCRQVFSDRSIEFDPLVRQATELLFEAQGNIKISEILRQVPLSERQLQKRFKREVGLTLKEFATAMRIRASIINLEIEKEDYQDTVFNSGYYDQAHFIRDFSNLSKISLPAFKSYIRNIHHVDVEFRK